MALPAQLVTSAATFSGTTPPSRLTLPADEIHIWQASFSRLAGTMHQHLLFLSDEERERAGRYFFERDSDSYIIGRGALRVLLARYLDMEPQQIAFQYGSHGKPGLRLSHQEITDLHFNLSNSNDLAVIALTRGCEIGVDVEFVRPVVDAEQIAGRFFSQHEIAELFALPREQRNVAFFNCWTRKEAFIKALGSGLSQPLDQFSVSLAPGEPAQLLQIAVGTDDVKQWSLRAWSPQADYVAAMAVPRSNFVLKYWLYEG